MIEDIANIVKNFFTPLAFVGKCVGLVKVVSRSENGKIIKFPVAFGPDLTACNQGSTYTDLIPNSAYKSILYFDEGNCQVTGRTGRSFELTSTIRLVGWLNAKLLQKADAALFEANILQGLPESPFNEGLYQKIMIQPVQIFPSDAGLFSKFSYDESVSQYLLHPYGCFGISFRVKFEMSVYSLCLPDFDWDLQPKVAPLIH